MGYLFWLYEGFHLLQLGTSSYKSLTLLVGGELREVLDKATCEILGLSVPLRSICIGVAGIQDCGVYAGQCCGHLEVEDRNLLGLCLVDRAIEDSVDDTTSILNRDTLACAIPTRIYKVATTPF